MNANGPQTNQNATRGAAMGGPSPAPLRKANANGVTVPASRPTLHHNQSALLGGGAALELGAQQLGRFGNRGHFFGGDFRGVDVALRESAKAAVRIQENLLRVVEFREFTNARGDLRGRFDFISARIHDAEADFLFVFVFLEHFEFAGARCGEFENELMDIHLHEIWQHGAVISFEQDFFLAAPVAAANVHAEADAVDAGGGFVHQADGKFEFISGIAAIRQRGAHESFSALGAIDDLAENGLVKLDELHAAGFERENFFAQNLDDVFGQLFRRTINFIGEAFEPAGTRKHVRSGERHFERARSVFFGEVHFVEREAIFFFEAFNDDRALDGERGNVERAKDFFVARAVFHVIHQLRDFHQAHAGELFDNEGIEIVASLFAVSGDVHARFLLRFGAFHDGAVGGGLKFLLSAFAGLAFAKSLDEPCGTRPASYDGDGEQLILRHGRFLPFRLYVHFSRDRFRRTDRRRSIQNRSRRRARRDGPAASEQENRARREGRCGNRQWFASRE